MCCTSRFRAAFLSPEAAAFSAALPNCLATRGPCFFTVCFTVDLTMGASFLNVGKANRAKNDPIP